MGHSNEDYFVSTGFHTDACFGWITSMEAKVDQDLTNRIFGDGFDLDCLTEHEFIPVGPRILPQSITLHCSVPASGLTGEVDFSLSGVSRLQNSVTAMCLQ